MLVLVCPVNGNTYERVQEDVKYPEKVELLATGEGRYNDESE